MNRVELQELAQKEQEQQQKFRCRLLCCASTPCLSSGANAVIETFKKNIEERKLKADVAVLSTGCMGPCSRGPLVTVQMQGQDDVIYERVTPDIAQQIIEKHVAAESPAPVKEYVLPNDDPFFAKQTKVVLGNSGLIDPERLEDYIAADGYLALSKALTRNGPRRSDLHTLPTVVCADAAAVVIRLV